MALRISALLLAASVGGCSLMGLADIDLLRCASDDDCAVFAERDDVPDTCRAYYCADGECLRHPAGGEVWDRWDNDCDGMVDEADAEGQTIAPEAALLAPGLDSATRVTFGADESGAMAASWLGPLEGEGWYAPLHWGDVTEGSQMSYLRGPCEPGGVCPRVDPYPGGSPDMRRLDVEEGCFDRLGETTANTGPCTFAEVAFGLTPSSTIVASIDPDGCTRGQLRLGFFPRGEDPGVLARGPWRRSTSVYGIDPTEGGRCTGAHRPGCTSNEEVCGAARPAMAALSDESELAPQVLAAWIGAAVSRGGCGGVESPVETVAAHLLTGVHEGEYSWVTASNEGVPQVLGRTTGGGSPAVVALGDSGYLVSHGDEGGQLALHFVPRAEEPVDYSGGYLCDGEDCQWDRLGRELGPLTGIVHFETQGGGGSGPVDHVAMALGRVTEDAVELGVAWREGCGTADEAVFFRRLRLAATAGVPAAVTDAGAASRLSGAGRVGPPALTYSPSGFVTAGFARDGSDPATADSGGGWVAAWAEVAGGRLVARRVLELDGAPLDESELITLAAEGACTDPRALHLVGSEGGVRFVYVDSSAGEIRGGELLSPPTL